MRSEGRRATIQVSDRGVGIDKEMFPYLFGAFLTADEASGNQGQGVSLALCKAIIDRHDGDIEVESAPASGTKVTISLPLEQAVTSPTLTSLSL